MINRKPCKCLLVLGSGLTRNSITLDRQAPPFLLLFWSSVIKLISKDTDMVVSIYAVFVTEIRHRPLVSGTEPEGIKEILCCSVSEYCIHSWKILQIKCFAGLTFLDVNVSKLTPPIQL